jgi:hypothetical protein
MKGQMKTKRFKKSDWKLMPVLKQPTTTCGQIREDEDGEAWVWVHGGKYVGARKAEAWEAMK